MGIVKDEKITLSDFASLKDYVNTLMQKRRYGDRPLNGQVASISDEAIPRAKDANSVYNPYQYMKSKNRKYDDRFSVGDRIEAELFVDELTEIKKYCDFSVYHNNRQDSDPATDGCGGECAGLCVLDCANACKVTCVGYCGKSCMGGCSGSCQNRCSDACSGCSGTCDVSCTTGCSDCSSGCEGACSGSSCTYGCSTGCDDGCGWNCEVACFGTCDADCKQDCNSKCNYDCQGGTNACDYCTAVCGDGCKGSCDNTCSKQCSDACYALCEGSCKGNCDMGCTAESEGYSCGGQCLALCSSGCSDSCSSTCFGDCQGSCSNVCSNTCGYDCALGCSGQAVQYDWEVSGQLPFSRTEVISSSGSWKVPEGVTTIRIMAVGGGGGSAGATAYYYKRYEVTDAPYRVDGSGGGAGGYTKSIEKSVTPGSYLYIEIGAGGAAGKVAIEHWNPDEEKQDQPVSDSKGGDGGDTIVYYPSVSSSNEILRASGGKSGGTYHNGSSWVWNHSWGGQGGSGGGDSLPENVSRSDTGSHILKSGLDLTPNHGGVNGGNGDHRYSTGYNKGQLSSVPSGISSDGKSTVCLYNKTSYGSGGGGGGARQWTGRMYEAEDPYDYDPYYYNIWGGKGLFGGGTGSSGNAWSGPQSGTNGSGGGGGGTQSAWTSDPRTSGSSYFRNGANGGTGAVIIAY